MFIFYKLEVIDFVDRNKQFYKSDSKFFDERKNQRRTECHATKAYQSAAKPSVCIPHPHLDNLTGDKSNKNLNDLKSYRNKYAKGAVTVDEITEFYSGRCYTGKANREKVCEKGDNAQHYCQ